MAHPCKKELWNVLRVALRDGYALLFNSQNASKWISVSYKMKIIPQWKGEHGQHRARLKKQQQQLGFPDTFSKTFVKVKKWDYGSVCILWLV